MSPAAGSAVAFLFIVLATPVAAGAWTQPKGQGQVIVKYEDMHADRGFDPEGRAASLPGPRHERTAAVFAEYGLTSRLTLQLKGDWQQGEDFFVDYRGRGPTELGVTWQAWRGERAGVSLYGGYARAGEGRNAGYAAPGVGEQDWELRASAGRSFAARRWLPGETFAELQLARRLRDGLPDEVRVDATVGSRFGEGWLLLTQAYGGAVDGDGARWLALETTVVRRLGRWSLQAGWRETVAGRETPIARGAVVGLWRRF